MAALFTRYKPSAAQAKSRLLQGEQVVRFTSNWRLFRFLCSGDDWQTLATP